MRITLITLTLTLVLTITAPTVLGRGGPATGHADTVVVSCALSNATQTSHFLSLSETHNGDVWAVTPDRIDIQLPGHAVSAFPSHACGVVVDDVEALIVDSGSPQAEGKDKADWFSDYHTYDEIAAWFAELAKSYPEVVSFQDAVGQSIEGRNIFAVRIAGPGPVPPSQRPQIYVQGLQHAREWIGGAVVQYIASQLATATNIPLLAEVEIVMVPIVNPDGYAYTWEHNRLWRKNRRNNGDGSFGVDLNRNWDDHWGGAGSSSNPASDTYHGKGPFSEPESLAVSDFLLQNSRVVAALDVHAYSQLILRPYGWTTATPPDNTLLETSGDLQAKAIKFVHGKTYQNIPSVDLYPTTGSAGDFFYGQIIKDTIGHYTSGFTWELRPASANPGFLLPPSEILPTGEEMWSAFLFWADYAVLNPID